MDPKRKKPPPPGIHSFFTPTTKKAKNCEGRGSITRPTKIQIFSREYTVVKREGDAGIRKQVDEFLKSGSIITAADDSNYFAINRKMNDLQQQINKLKCNDDMLEEAAELSDELHNLKMHLNCLQNLARAYIAAQADKQFLVDRASRDDLLEAAKMRDFLRGIEQRFPGLAEFLETRSAFLEEETTRNQGLPDAQSQAAEEMAQADAVEGDGNEDVTEVHENDGEEMVAEPYAKHHSSARARSVQKGGSTRVFDVKKFYVSTKQWNELMKKTFTVKGEHNVRLNEEHYHYNPKTARVFCECCAKPLTYKNAKEHKFTKAHITAKAEYEKRKDKNVLVQSNLPKDLLGQTSDVEERVFRINLAEVFFRAGIPFTAVKEFKGFLQDYTGKNPGNERVLANYIPTILRDEKIRVAKLFGECYKYFTIIHDGTPIFAEALAVKVRAVHKETFCIVEFLIHLQLYDESFNGETMGNEILSLFRKKDSMNDSNPFHGVLKKENWRVCGTDRCAVNYSALKHIKRKTNGTVAPFFTPCVPHGLSNTGKKLLVTFANTLRKLMNKMTKHGSSRARVKFLLKFQQKPKQSGKVRWFCDLIHIMQLHALNIDDIREFAEECRAANHSKKTAAKLVRNLKDHKFVVFCVVEMAAALDIGVFLCRLTYVLEGDAPLLFVAGQALRGFEEKFIEEDLETIQMPLLEEASAKAAKRVESILAPLRLRCKLVELELDKAKENLKTAENEQAASRHNRRAASNRAGQPQPQQTVQSRTTGRRRPDRDYDEIANGGAATSKRAQERERLKQMVENAEEAVRIAEQKVAEEQSNLTTAKNTFKSPIRGDESCLLEKEDFISYGRLCVEPAIQYYKATFCREHTGEGTPNYFQMRRLFFAVEALNPLMAKSMPIVTLQDRIRMLKDVTQFPELLDDEFMDEIMEELRFYKEKVDNFPEKDWECLPRAEEYNERLLKKVGSSNTGKTWRDDTSETARRVWEWWKGIGRCPQLCNLNKLVAIVALIQVSSASVERVFSQLKTVVDTVQQSSLQDGIEARTMMRINHRSRQQKNLTPSLDSLLTNGEGELHWMQPLDQLADDEVPEQLEDRYEDDPDDDISSDEEEEDG